MIVNNFSHGIRSKTVSKEKQKLRKISLALGWKNWFSGFVKHGA